MFLINNVCIIHLIVCGANVLSENLFSAICKQVVESDKLVHFAGIANQMGKLVTSTYQQGVIPLMNEEEISQYALRAVVRATTHEDFENYNIQ